MNLDDIIIEQKEVCSRIGAEYQRCDFGLKIGISRKFDADQYPLNGLRHPPAGDITGWYIWSGEDFSDDAAFFVPVHAAHLLTRAKILIKYLGLTAGWRFLVAPDYEDVWWDKALLLDL
jgi:hypothetical protein